MLDLVAILIQPTSPSIGQHWPVQMLLPNRNQNDFFVTLPVIPNISLLKNSNKRKCDQN